MPEIATTLQKVQIGVETTPGTGVAANKVLPFLTLDPSAQHDVAMQRAQGFRYPVTQTRGRTWTEAKISGPLSYNEAPYLFSSLLHSTTPTTVVAGVYSWAFTPSSNSPDSPKTFTIEQGDATTARKFSYGLVSSLKITHDKEAIAFDGSMIGKTLAVGQTLTSSPTTVATGSPLTPNSAAVALSSTSGGTFTALNRVLKFEAEFTERWKPVFNIADVADESFVAHVDTESDVKMKLSIAADSAGEAFVTALRQRTVQWITYTVTGPTISGANKFNFIIKAAFNVESIGELKDSDGVYMYEPTLVAVHDSTWGKAVEVTVQNSLATL